LWFCARFSQFLPLPNQQHLFHTELVILPKMFPHMPKQLQVG